MCQHWLKRLHSMLSLVWNMYASTWQSNMQLSMQLGFDGVRMWFRPYTRLHSMCSLVRNLYASTCQTSMQLSMQLGSVQSVRKIGTCSACSCWYGLRASVGVIVLKQRGAEQKGQVSGYKVSPQNQNWPVLHMAVQMCSMHWLV